MLLSAGLVIPRLLRIGGGEDIIRNKQKYSLGGREERKIIVSGGPRLREMLVAAESREQCWAGIWFC